MNNLKTEIEKINQEIKDEEDEEWREILKERKQGLIQGAKMMIEDFNRFLERKNNFDKGMKLMIMNGKNRKRMVRIFDIFEELGVDKMEKSLKQLNNWLEKE